MCRRRGIVIDVLTEAAIFAVADELLDGEGDLAFIGIDADDLGFVDFADLDDVRGILNMIAAKLADVDEAFDAIGDLGECAEFRDFRDLAIDDGAGRIHVGECFPGISGQLLDAEAEAFIFDVDVEDDSFDLIAALVDFGRIADFLCPADIGDMDEAVDAIFDTNEETEIGDIADFSDDACADGIFFFKKFPRIGLGLFHAEADFLGIGIEAQHNDVDDVTDLDDAARMFDTFCPAHLADVDETLDALFEFDECTVVDEADDAAQSTNAGRITLCGVFPRIWRELFVAQADALIFFRVLEDFDLDLVADLNDFVRMIDTTPAHIGDVEEAVDAAQVNERTVFGDILDDTVEDGTFVETFFRLCLENIALFFEQGAAAQNDVATFLVELDDLETVRLADEFVEVAGRTELDLAAGQKGADADIDSEAALDAADDLAFHGLVGFGDLGDFFPDHELVRFLLAQNAETIFIFRRLDEDINLVTDLDVERAIGCHKFGLGDNTFRLVADIYDDKIIHEINNGTADDLTFTNFVLLLLLKLREKRFKAFNFLGHLDSPKMVKKKGFCFGYKGHLNDSATARIVKKDAPFYSFELFCQTFFSKYFAPPKHVPGVGGLCALRRIRPACGWLFSARASAHAENTPPRPRYRFAIRWGL